MSPVAEFPLRETQKFLARFARPGRLLEVGCGGGELAQLLSGEGWEVLGIDVDPRAVAAARDRGVEVRQADVLRFESEPFDVVLVTQSLHHVHPLEAAARKLAELVRPGGWLIVEEYDHAAYDEATAEWLRERAELLRAGRLVREGGEHHGQKAHHHAAVHASMHTGAEMRAALGNVFRVVAEENVPYQYRRLAAQLVAGDRAVDLARVSLEQEQRAIDAGRIRALGLRIAARRA